MAKKNEEILMLTLERMASTLERIEMNSVPKPEVSVKTKVLKEYFIEKACEWLTENLFPTVKTNFDNIVDVESTGTFLEKFRIAMEE